jgi:hypothetical protein
MSKTDAQATTALTPPGNAKLVIPAELRDRVKRDAGQGVSTKADDQLLPLIYVLHYNSPQVDKRGNAYEEGAEAGDFWLRGALNPIRGGIEGIEVQPCMMLRRWVEWLPSRGGYVTEHDQPPADLESRKSSENGIEKTELVRKGNNNTIVDTRKFYVVTEGRPFVLPCKSTQHTFARKWNTDFNQRRDPDTGAVLPAFLHRYRLTTLPDENAKGKYFSLKFTHIGLVSTPEYDLGKQLYESVARGIARDAMSTSNDWEA